MKVLARGSALLVACAFTLQLRADPNDPELRFWVQTNDGMDPMFHTLVMDDHRIHPIIVTRAPLLSGSQFPCDVAADAVLKLRAITLDMEAPSDGFAIGIMIQNFGGGGRGRANANQVFDYVAPALVRPPLLDVSGITPCGPAEMPWHISNLADPNSVISNTGGRLNNDYYRETASGSCNGCLGVGTCAPWWTPWPDLGPTDCAEWLGEFAIVYGQLVQALADERHQFQSDYAPWRLIFDNENDVAPTVAGPMICNLLHDQTRNSAPVKGMPDHLRPVVFDSQNGPSITILHDPDPMDPNSPNLFNPPCDGCNGD